MSYKGELCSDIHCHTVAYMYVTLSSPPLWQRQSLLIYPSLLLKCPYVKSLSKLQSEL